jgi:hypothetical protein
MVGVVVTARNVAAGVAQRDVRADVGADSWPAPPDPGAGGRPLHKANIRPTRTPEKNRRSAQAPLSQTIFPLSRTTQHRLQLHPNAPTQLTTRFKTFPRLLKKGVPRAGRALSPLVLALLLAPAVAYAEPTPKQLERARSLFAEAEEFEARKDYMRALDDLRKVAEVKLTPGVRFHIALCEEQLGQWLQALDDFAKTEEQARKEGNEEVLAAVKEPLGRLRARVPKIAVGAPNVASATVKLDGRTLAPADIGKPLEVAVGAHRIESEAAGYQPYSREISAREFEVVSVDVQLTPAVTDAPTSAPAPSPAPRESRPSSPSHTAAIAATAGAIVLVAGGLGAFLTAGAKQSDAQATCVTLTNCDDRKTEVRTWDTLALGAWVASAALGILAGVLWLSPSPAARASAGLGSAGLEGTF